MKDYSVRELHDGAIDDIPTQGGIYYLKMPRGFEIRIKEKNDGRQFTSKGKPSEYAVEELNRKAKLVYGETGRYRTDIIYIGETNHNVGLQKRLREYIGFRYCESTRAHDGGRAAWQIDNNEELLVHVEVVDPNTNPKDVEKAMLADFKTRFSDYPLANRIL